MKKINNIQMEKLSGGGFWAAVFVIAAAVDAAVEFAQGFSEACGSYQQGPRRAGHR